MSTSENPANIIAKTFTAHFFGTMRRVENRQGGKAHQADERGGSDLPRVVAGIQPTGIRDLYCCC